MPYLHFPADADFLHTAAPIFTLFRLHQHYAYFSIDAIRQFQHNTTMLMLYDDYAFAFADAAFRHRMMLLRFAIFFAS